MKKLMIGILIVIPVIIVATVAAVSVVVSTSSYIGVESITLDKNVVELAFGDVYYNLGEYLSVDVLPKKATNPEYVWKVESVNCWDKDYLDAWNNYLNGTSQDEVLPPVSLVDEGGNPVDSNSSGDIMVNSYCSFVLVAQAETMSARCNVIVSGAGLESVTILGVNSLKVGDSTSLLYEKYPIDGIITKEEWLSSDEGVVKVDRNGIVTAVGAGKATVTLKAYKDDDTFVESTFDLSVAEGVSTFGDKVYICENTFKLSALGVDEADLLSHTGCTVEGDLVTFDDVTATLVLEDGTLTVNKCQQGEIQIENGDFFDHDTSDFVLVTGSKVYLKARSLCSICSEIGVVTWSVDNDGIATIDQSGILTAVGEGLVHVTASCGGHSVMIEVNVHRKVTTLVIDRTAKELSAVGIAREYVMASERYVDAGGTLQKEPNFFDFDILRPIVPVDEDEREGFYHAFIFEVTENGAPTEKAYFENNRLVFVPERIDGKTTLTVTIKARNPMYASLENLTTQVIDIKVTDAVAVGNFTEIKKACDDHESVSLYDDIMLFDGDDRPVGIELYCFGDYYGNAHILSALRGQIQPKKDLIVFGESDIVVSNAIFRANELDGDTITSEGEGALEGRSLAIRRNNYGDNFKDETRMKNVIVEFCILENGKSLLDVDGTDMTLRGCIMRNSSGAGIIVDTVYDASLGVMYSNFTMENCVMSNLLGMGLSFPYYYYDKGGKEMTEQFLAEGKNTHFYQVGFLDIYNWQPANTMGLIPTGTLGGGMEALENGINAMLREEFMKESLAPYRYTYNGVDYFLLGGMSMGLIHKSYLEGTLSDPRITYFDSTIVDNLLIQAFSKTPANLFTYRNDVTDITPGASYIINDRLIKKLHGEGVEYGEPTPFSFV